MFTLFSSNWELLLIKIIKISVQKQFPYLNCRKLVNKSSCKALAHAIWIKINFRQKSRAMFNTGTQATIELEVEN